VALSITLCGAQFKTAVRVFSNIYGGDVPCVSIWHCASRCAEQVITYGTPWRRRRMLGVGVKAIDKQPEIT
jgi:hypothetical protein